MAEWVFPIFLLLLAGLSLALLTLCHHLQEVQ